MAIAIGAAVAVTASVASTEISGAINGGGGATGGGSGGTTIQQQQYSYYGPHPSTTPLSNTAGNKAENENVTIPLDKQVTKAKVTTAGEVPAARDNKSTVGPDFSQSWGNRLSRYLDYNSRQLG